MRTIAMALTSGVLLAGLGVAVFAQAQALRGPAIIEGKDRPIVLARVVVTATALPDSSPGEAHD